MPEVRPTILPSVPRVYEKVHTAVTSAFAEATGVRRRLIDWALDVGRRESALRAAGQAAAARARPAAPARRPARLLEGEGAPRRPAADPDLGRRAAREGDRRVLRRAGHPDPRGVRPDGVHDRGDDEPPRPLPLRHGRAGAARLRARARGGRRAADQERDGLRGLLQGARGDRRGAGRGRLAALGRHRDDRRGRLRHDHRPQEGHHRHGRRQEHRAAEPRERPQDLPVRLAGDRHRRPAAVSGGADHARPRRDRQVGGRAGDRRRRGLARRRPEGVRSSSPGSSRTSTASAHATSS